MLGLSVILFTISLLSLGTYVLAKNIRSRTNRSFAYLVFSITLWIVCLYLSDKNFSTSLNLLTNRLVFSMGTATAFMFLFFTKNFPREARRVWSTKAILTTLLLLSLIFLTTLTPLTVRDVQIYEQGINPLFSFFFYPLMLLNIGLIINGFYELLIKYKQSQGLARYQIKYLLFGFFALCLFEFPLTLIIPLITGSTITSRYAPFAIIIFLAITAYSIVKHRLFGIKFALASSLHFLIISIFTGITFNLISFIQANLHTQEGLLFIIITIFLYSYLFLKLNGKLQSFLKGMLRDSNYDTLEILNELQNLTTKVQNLDKLISKILMLMKQAFNCEKIGIVLFERNKDTVNYRNLIGYDLHIEQYAFLSEFKQRGPIVYDEILAQEQQRSDKKIDRLFKFLKREKTAVLFPLTSKKQTNGFLLMGYKKNKEAYTVQDINLLEKITSKLSKVVRSFIITSEDVIFALKNLSSPHLLEGSKLLRLRPVERLSKEKNISAVDALKDILTSAIEYFKPEDKGNKRTAARLKYEILRMIAFEGATESQIMWDLGFDVYTRSVEEKLQDQRDPRFKLKDASEYSATSDRSFKRLKKEAVEMVRWKLEEGEK